MTKANVFIIESLDIEDEKQKRCEGSILKQILHLGGKKSKYKYIRNVEGFEDALVAFRKSRYRYLHLSCHGDDESIGLTEDTMDFSEFTELISPYLERKRLFLSVCSVANEKLASILIPASRCYSIVGPFKPIDFSDAAIIWASFYHLAFKVDPDKMTRSILRTILRKVVNTFGIHLNYFSIKGKKGFKGEEIKPRMRYIIKKGRGKTA